MINRLALMCVALGSVLFLAACSTPTPPPKVNLEITFQHLPPVQLDVARIDVVDAYNIGGSAPRIEHLYGETPASLARRWVAERITPAGRQGLATLIIEEASVTEEKLQPRSGFEGLFNDDRDVKFVGKLSRLEFREIDGMATRSFVAKADAYADRVLLESATLNERDTAYYRILESLAKNFDETMLAEIRRVMGPIILNGTAP